MGVAGGCVHGEVEAVGRAVCCVRGPGGVHSMGGSRVDAPRRTLYSHCGDSYHFSK